jgi:hypothetical protein
LFEIAVFKFKISDIFGYHTRFGITVKKISGGGQHDGDVVVINHLRLKQDVLT